MTDIQTLMRTMPQQGRVTFLGVRPGKGEPMHVSEALEARPGAGLTGDRFAARRTLREVTLIQQEHIDAVASILGLDSLDPAILRRNIVVAGINLLALKTSEFSVGDVRFRGTGLAHPCSKMEKALGPGG